MSALCVFSLAFCGCAGEEATQRAAGGNAESSLAFDANPSDFEEEKARKESSMPESDEISDFGMGAASTGGPHLEWISAIVNEIDGREMTVIVVDAQSGDERSACVRAAAWVDDCVLDNIHVGTEIRFSFVAGFHQPIPSEMVAYGIEIMGT